MVMEIEGIIIKIICIISIPPGATLFLYMLGYPNLGCCIGLLITTISLITLVHNILLSD